MRIGQRIMELRRDAGLTQNQLAAALFVSRDLVSKWETGKRLPEYRMILKIAKVFSVDPETLMPKDSVLTAELSPVLPENVPPDGETLKDHLNRFLSGLPPRDRGVFIRRYYFFDDPAEIGEVYGINANHVRMILTRVRRKLKQYLKEAYQ